jgi:hypothetical protein
MSSSSHPVARLKAGPARQRRAIALVVTVLLLAIAATIVLTLAASSITSTRTSSSEANDAQAGVFVSNAQAAVQSALQANPYFYFSSVFTDTINGVVYSEQARICGPTGVVINPGQAWSVTTCGTTWTYVAPTTTPSAWIEIIPPSYNQAALTVDIVGTSGGVSSAQTLTYHLDGSERYSLWSSTNLDLSQLPSGSTLAGSVYSEGTIGLPSGSTLTNTQLEAEQGFTTTPSDTTQRYYSESTTSNTPPIQSIRAVAPTILTAQALRSSLAQIIPVACPGGTPWWNANNSTVSSLCLRAGGTVRVSANATATIPPNVTGYLLIFNGSTSSVTVYYSTNPISPDPSCSTQSCDFVNVATADASNSPLTNPGELAYWTTNGNTLLGTLPLPQSGLIATDQDTYIGECSTGANTPFSTLNGTCPSLSGTQSGILVGNDITVIAGTPTNPANVWLNSSINTSPGVSFGAIASGSIYLPYWARPPGSTTQILSGAYTALGYGVDSGTSPIQSFPTSVSGDSTNPDDMASTLDINGSLASPALSLTAPFAFFNQVNITGSSALTAAAPPYFANFTGTWTLSTSTVVNPSSLSAPGAPTSVTATAGTKQATLSWNAPGGVSASTYYTATASPGGLSCTTYSTSCTITGLTSGTSYKFTVTATSPPAVSNASTPSNAVTVN